MKDKLQGKAEELKGRVTGDTKEELKGKARQKLGQGREDLHQAAREIDQARQHQGADETDPENR